MDDKIIIGNLEKLVGKEKAQKIENIISKYYQKINDKKYIFNKEKIKEEIDNLNVDSFFSNQLDMMLGFIERTFNSAGVVIVTDSQPKKEKQITIVDDHVKLVVENYLKQKTIFTAHDVLDEVSKLKPDVDITYDQVRTTTFNIVTQLSTKYNYIKSYVNALAKVDDKSMDTVVVLFHPKDITLPARWNLEKTGVKFKGLEDEIKTHISKQDYPEYTRHKNKRAGITLGLPLMRKIKAEPYDQIVILKVGQSMVVMKKEDYDKDSLNSFELIKEYKVWGSGTLEIGHSVTANFYHLDKKAIYKVYVMDNKVSGKKLIIL